MNVFDSLYLISNIVNGSFAAVCGVLSLYHAQRRTGDALFYYLLTGAFACALLSDIYYMLVAVLLDYPYVISPGDLSWVGGLLFLITAELELADKWTPGQKAAAGKYRLPALTAPVVCVVFNIVYIRIYPEITANYLLYGIPTAALSYFTLWLFLSSGKNGVPSTLRPYHLMILLWIAMQLLHDLFSTFGMDYGYAVPVVICAWLVTLTLPCIYLAARAAKKGAGA
jgi:hypothetical protein